MCIQGLVYLCQMREVRKCQTKQFDKAKEKEMMVFHQCVIYICHTFYIRVSVSVLNILHQ